MSEFEDTLNDPAAMTPEVVALSARPSPIPGPPQVVYESNPTGRWSRPALEMRPLPKPVRRVPRDDLSTVEARVLADQFRDRFPEITKIWADVSAAYRGRK